MFPVSVTLVQESQICAKRFAVGAGFHSNEEEATPE